MDLRGLKFSVPDARGLCRVDGDYEQIQLLRIVPGVAWDHAARCWKAPANIIQPSKLDLPSRSPIDAVNLVASAIVLRQYQIDAIEFLETSIRGCIIGDDVGLGKTTVTSCYLHRNPKYRPFLIVGPLIATGSWVGPQADPEKFFGLRVAQLRTTTPEEQKLPPDYDGYFINYDILPNWLPWIMLAVDPRVIIIDEAHEIRNVRNKASKAVHKICQLKSVEKRILLSATPVVNRVMDLYHLLDCAQPGLWGHYVPFNERIITSFGTRYAAAEHNGYGWQVGGESNTIELKQRLANVLIRRSRFDVRKELPPFERQNVIIDPANLEKESYLEYRKAAQALAHAGTFITAAELQRTTAMASHLSWSKRNVAVECAKNLALSTENRKIVVYTWYKKTATYIAKALKKKGCIAFGPVTGESNINKRLQQAQDFKDIKLPANTAAVFVATLGAAGIALNPLSAASAVLFVDLYWVPAILLQAEGRVHREGQTAKTVLATYLTVENSIDTIMFEKLERKSKTIAKTTGDQAGATLCEALGGRNEEESLKAFVADLGKLEQLALEIK